MTRLYLPFDRTQISSCIFFFLKYCGGKKSIYYREKKTSWGMQPSHVCLILVQSKNSSGKYIKSVKKINNTIEQSFFSLETNRKYKTQPKTTQFNESCLYYIYIDIYIILFAFTTLSPKRHVTKWHYTFWSWQLETSTPSFRRLVQLPRRRSSPP